MPTMEAKWAHSRLRTIEFPEGGDADVEPCDMSELIYGSPEDGIEPTVPNDLVGIAERTEYEGVDTEKLSPDERRLLTRYRHWVISDRTRRYRFPDGTEVRSLTTKDARLMPYENQIAIFRAALHTDLAERLMLASFRSVQSGPAGNGSGTAEGDSAK
ncbi:MAG TPA: hypothetical protein VNN79_20235 [Actinomycetota bacterium]|nr:hypothetical protein [Actinomycetota bacterium]